MLKITVKWETKLKINVEKKILNCFIGDISQSGPFLTFESFHSISNFSRRTGWGFSGGRTGGSFQ